MPFGYWKDFPDMLYDASPNDNLYFCIKTLTIRDQTLITNKLQSQLTYTNMIITNFAIL